MALHGAYTLNTAFTAKSLDTPDFYYVQASLFFIFASVVQ